MSSDKDKTVNFVIVRTMTPREVVDLLLSRFPSMRDLVCPDEDSFEEPTIVYDSFASRVCERADDPGFIQSVVLFIDELSESKDSLIQNVLSVCLLEGIASNEPLARMISRSISPRSKTLLQEVESQIYGRAPSD